MVVFVLASKTKRKREEEKMSVVLLTCTFPLKCSFESGVEWLAPLPRVPGPPFQPTVWLL